MTGQGLFGTTFLRFLAVGAGLALVYALLAAFATSTLPLPTAVSAAAAWVACVPLGFYSHRRLTFADSVPHRFALGIYAVTQMVGIGIGATVSFLFARGIFWPDLVVHLSASALAAVASYLINRTLAFPGNRPR